MTERGVSVREATLPTLPSVYLAAIDVYRVYEKPLRAASIWSRLNDVGLGAPRATLDPRVLDGLAQRGVRPVIFGETYTPYADIRAGRRDDELRAWGRALKGRGAWLRIDQEQNGGTEGDPTFPWQGQPPTEYRETGDYMHDVVRSEAPDVLLMTSPSARYGDDAASIVEWVPRSFEVVGWTAYQRGPRRDLMRQWDDMLRAYEAAFPGKPVCVSECGRLKGLPERLEYARDLHRVKWVDLVIAFDMDLESPRHRWRMTSRQRRAYMTGA